jgi:hypothetical protein
MRKLRLLWVGCLALWSLGSCTGSESTANSNMAAWCQARDTFGGVPAFQFVSGKEIDEQVAAVDELVVGVSVLTEPTAGVPDEATTSYINAKAAMVRIRDRVASGEGFETFLVGDRDIEDLSSLITEAQTVNVPECNELSAKTSTTLTLPDSIGYAPVEKPAKK